MNLYREGDIMTYTEKTKKLLWGKSGCVCAFPGCHKALIGNEGDIQGEMCHIVARNKGGPRWRGNFEGDISGEENLILLCAEHHKLVDDFPQKYTEELLHQYKRNHEDEVKARINSGQPWKVNFSQIYYMNLPRIEMLAAVEGINFNSNVQAGKGLHNLGWDLNYLLLGVSDLMNRMSFHAAPLNTEWRNLHIGQIVEINDKFRTKNVPGVDVVDKNKYHPKGDLQRDAHLYSDNEYVRRILTIDPHWLTTTTAFVNFRSGWIDVAGLGLITCIDKVQKRIIITPYVLGVPKSGYDDLFRRFM